jgi:hypothetical protein
MKENHPLEDLDSDNPIADTITPLPAAVPPAWGAAKAFVDECKAWGEGLEERLRDAVRSEALAREEAAAAAREEVVAVRKEAAAAREREEAASRGREEVLKQLRAQQDESIEQRRFWLNKEENLLERIRGSELAANS